MNTGIISRIWDIIYYCKDPRMDGFTQFEQKKTLYMINRIIEDELKKCPTFVGEQEWLKENKIGN